MVHVKILLTQRLVSCLFFMIYKKMKNAKSTITYDSIRLEVYKNKKLTSGSLKTLMQ